jgi:hypothetical protein
MGWSGDWRRVKNGLLMKAWAGRQRIGFGQCDWNAAGEVNVLVGWGSVR